MERLKSMKESLMSCAQAQMGNLHEVNAEELGEVIDMIKDLEEAIYYCTITEAMNKKEEQPMYTPSTQYYSERVIYPPRDNYYYDGENGRNRDRMYFDGETTSNGNTGQMRSQAQNTTSSTPASAGGLQHFYTETIIGKDPREGRSPMQRRKYFQSRENHEDKSMQLKELEHYMTDLSEDLVEMIKEASPEEKQYLEKRISQLATKISNV